MKNVNSFKKVFKIDDQEEELDPDVLRKMNQIVLLTIVERENKRFCSHCQKFKVCHIIY